MQKKKELHIAPMLNYSTREFRQLFRILSKRVVLWTEMVVDDTILHCGNLDKHLGDTRSTQQQNPIICQIGGNSPEMCGAATKIVLDDDDGCGGCGGGYDEVNLNIDCPSNRVSGEREFGACLMKKAELAAQILDAMQKQAQVHHTPPKKKMVSVKCRIGVDELDNIEFMVRFIKILEPYCQRFYLHARKCVLDGKMNARQNRSVPPLNYPRVYQLCRMLPHLEFWLNGGIRTLKHAKQIAYGSSSSSVCFARSSSDAPIISNSNMHKVPCQLCQHDAYGSCVEPPLVAPPNLRGCMVGRAAIEDPCLFHDVDKYFYGEPSNPCQNRREVLERYCDYLERVYPRRCCDNDDRITDDYPAPDVIIRRDGHDCEEYCNICAEMYKIGSSGDIKNHRAKNPVVVVPGNANNGKSNQIKKTIKISSRIIGRSLKPVQGIFINIPNSRAFRRVCDALVQDIEIRNCGPGFILRKAMLSVPADILDQEFETTLAG